MALSAAPLLCCGRLWFRALGHTPGYDLVARFARRGLASRSRWFTPEVGRGAPQRRGGSSLRLETAQRQSVASMPLPLYLRIEDRNSMAHGVEVRVPFLDHHLASYALALPIDWRIRGKWNKYALRQALRGKIPEIVRTRQDKMGFPVPQGRWLANELFEPLRDVLGSRPARERGLYRTDNLLRELDRNRGSVVQEHGVMFRAANVELWLSMLAARRAEARRASADRAGPAVRVSGGHRIDRSNPGAGKTQRLSGAD